MRQLDYGRDNRLRLWLLGIKDADKLDECITPSEEQFIELMTTCLANWKEILKRQSYCILVVGDTKSQVYGERLSDVISNLAVDAVGGYELRATYQDHIPLARRVRKDCRGSLTETVLILQRR
jgi:hypothetical protein